MTLLMNLFIYFLARLAWSSSSLFFKLLEHPIILDNTPHAFIAYIKNENSEAKQACGIFICIYCLQDSSSFTYTLHNDKLQRHINCTYA